MVGLAILLLVQSAASFALAGLSVAAFAGGSAVGGVAQARRIDRTRQTPALVASGLAHPLALALLVPAARAAALPALLGLGVVAGAAAPQLSACMRTLWIELLPEGRRRAAAFALEAVLVEAVFLVGPALVAGLLAVTGPAGVLLLAAASGTGTLGLAATGASRAWRGRSPVSKRSGPRLAGPLSSPAIRLVLAAAVLFGIGDGAVQVAVAGFAVRHGSERLAGLLLTAMSVGSVAAGLAYGTRSWRGSWAARFAALNWLLGTAVALAALAMHAGGGRGGAAARRARGRPDRHRELPPGRRGRAARDRHRGLRLAGHRGRGRGSGGLGAGRPTARPPRRRADHAAGRGRADRRGRRDLAVRGRRPG
jgi:hypothetical protein